NQTGGKGRQSIILFFRPVVLDSYILTLDKTGFLQTLAERGHISRGRVCAGRCAGEEADHRYRLLRVRGEWPHGCRAAENSDELPPSHLASLLEIARTQRRQVSTRQYDGLRPISHSRLTAPGPSRLKPMSVLMLATGGKAAVRRRSQKR